MRHQNEYTRNNQRHQRLEFDSIDVYVANHVPKLLSTPTAVVTNLDTSNKPGSDWVANYKDENGYGIYFDSYRVALASKYHLDRPRKNCDRFQWNKNQVQSVASQVYGKSVQSDSLTRDRSNHQPDLDETATMDLSKS